MQKRFNPLRPEAEANKPRPEALKRGTITHPLPIGPAPIVTENVEKDGLELRFPKRPGPAVLEFFHSTKDLPPEQRWHFHFKGKYWYAKRNEATRKFAQMIIAHASEKAPEQPAPVTEAKPAFVPAVVPTRFEVEWQEQTAQGLTKLPYDVWVEKFAEAAGDTHPEPVEETEMRIIPVTFKPAAATPAWKQRMRWAGPTGPAANGNPSQRY